MGGSAKGYSKEGRMEKRKVGGHSRALEKGTFTRSSCTMLGDSESNHGGSGQEDKRVDGGGKA